MDFIKYFNELEFNFFDESLDVHVILDLERNRFIKCSNNVENMYGYTKEEFLNITPYDLSLEFLNQTQMESKQESILEKGYDKFITKHKTKNDEILDVYVKSKRIDKNNSHILFITLINLAKEKQLHEYFEKKFKEGKNNFITIQKIYQWNDYTQTLLKNGKLINLSKNEIILMLILVKNIDSPISKEKIFKKFNFKISYNSLISMIKRIRKKTSKEFIKSVYQEGYLINS